MKLTDLHAGIQDMIYYEQEDLDLENVQEWYSAVSDYLYWEATKPYAGGSWRVRASLGYPRELGGPENPNPSRLMALYDYVPAWNIQEDDVFKLAEFLAEVLDRLTAVL
jgi:hypothetical protein